MCVEHSGEVNGVSRNYKLIHTFVYSEYMSLRMDFGPLFLIDLWENFVLITMKIVYLTYDTGPFSSIKVNIIYKPVVWIVLTQN